MTSRDVSNDVIRSLAMEPRKDVRCWDHFYINNYNFHTYSYGKNKSTMNYGVSVKGVDGVEYYGILQEVIELTYLGTRQLYKTVLFKCDWFDSVNGINIHEHYKLVDVNHTKKYPKYDPFVLAYQATQVSFTSYPSMKNDRIQWWAVLKMKPRAMIDSQMDDIAPFQEENNNNPPTLSHLDIDEDISINDDLADDLPEGSELGTHEDEDGEDEEEEDDINIDEQELETLLANEDED